MDGIQHKVCYHYVMESPTPILDGIRSQNPNLLGSGKMVAIVECLMGVPVPERSTADKLDTICATSDGFVLGRLVGDIGYNEFLGSFDDLDRNVRGVAEHFGAPQEAEPLMMAIRIAGVDS